jgi:hypothetical protein
MYLALFFIWPMFRGLGLAVWDADAELTLRAGAGQASAEAGRLPQGAPVEIIERQGNLLEPGAASETNLLTERWFQIQGEGESGAALEGWAPETRIRVREESDEGVPVAGSVRRRLGSGAEQLTSVHVEPSERSEVVGSLESGVEVAIVNQAILEVWFHVRGDGSAGNVEGMGTLTVHSGIR